MMKYIDLSMPIENDVKSDPEPYGPKITYLKHTETFEQIAPFFPGLKQEQMPGGKNPVLSWTFGISTMGMS